jgi:glycosyltransferase involved in cell wall biosynthesis
MKIASIIISKCNGGAEQVFIDYMNAFKILNHQNYAIINSIAPYDNEVNELTNKVLKVKNNFGYYDFIAIKQIKNFLIEQEIDYIFAHSSKAIVLARKAIKKIKNSKILLVAINHSNNVKRSIGADLILSVNKKIFYKTIDLNQKEDRSFVVNNVIDTKNLIRKNKVELSKKNKITIGVIGRLHQAKGFDLAINVIDFIKKNKTNNFFSKQFCEKEYSLIIAGDGEEKNNLINQINKLDVANDVKFLGWVDKKIFFEQIDIFLLTSRIETFGLVLLEAMKYQIPIITSDADGPCEILRRDVDALFVNLNDQEIIKKQFAKHIEELVTNDNKTNLLIDNAFTRLNDKFSFDNLVNSLKEIVGVGK